MLDDARLLTNAVKQRWAHALGYDGPAATCILARKTEELRYEKRGCVYDRVLELERALKEVKKEGGQAARWDVILGIIDKALGQPKIEAESSDPPRCEHYYGDGPIRMQCQLPLSHPGACKFW